MQEAEPDNRAGRKEKARDHSRRRALLVHAGAEDAQHDHGEERARGQAKGECDHLRDKSWRIDPQPTRHDHRTHNGNSRGPQLSLFRNIGKQPALEQVVRNTGRHHQQQTRCGGEGRRQTTGGNQRHHPIGKARNFWVGQDHDVTVHIQLVLGVGGFIDHHPFAMVAPRFVGSKRRLAHERRPGRVVHGAITILVDPSDQPDVFPRTHPLGQWLDGRVVIGFGRDRPRRVTHRFHQVVAGKNRNGGSGGVQQRNKEQRPQRAGPRIANFWHRKKPNDHMGQARRTHHQRQSDGKEIENIPPALLGVGRESQLTIQSFQFGQHAGFFTAPSEAELWNGKSRKAQREEDCGNHEGKNQNAILRHLGVGNAFHTAKDGVEQHDGHPHQHTGLNRHFQESSEDHPNAPHLTRDICE